MLKEWKTGGYTKHFMLCHSKHPDHVLTVVNEALCQSWRWRRRSGDHTPSHPHRTLCSHHSHWERAHWGEGAATAGGGSDDISLASSKNPRGWKFSGGHQGWGSQCHYQRQCHYWGCGPSSDALEQLQWSSPAVYGMLSSWKKARLKASEASGIAPGHQFHPGASQRPLWKGDIQEKIQWLYRDKFRGTKSFLTLIQTVYVTSHQFLINESSHLTCNRAVFPVLL